MIIDPTQHYGADYWTHQKPYRVVSPDGRIEWRLYQGPALHWEGFGPIVRAVLAGLRKSRADAGSWLDIGCGGGSAVKFLADAGAAVRGVDISPYAIEAAEKLVPDCCVAADVLAAELAGETFAASDVVSAFDLVEHVYMDDQLRLWDRFQVLVRPGGRLVLCVATAHQRTDEWEHRTGTEVPLEREWQAVSGHVSVQTPQFWYGWARGRGWTLDQVAMDTFECWRATTEGYKDMAAWGPDNFMVFARGV